MSSSSPPRPISVADSRHSSIVPGSDFEIEMSAKRVQLSESQTPSERTTDVEITLDPSILDCPICFGPLQLPLFQCINGHVTCSECSRKFVGKCRFCFTTATSRCIPFEYLIESRKRKCTYANCREIEMSSKRVQLSDSQTPSERTTDIEVTLDPPILDCPICFGPLQLPLFQCINGHVVCSECSRKFVGKCRYCSTTATSRCIPFEYLIESCKRKCTYANCRCPVSLPLNKITSHEHQCRYAPRTCPIPDCRFICEEFRMSTHIGSEHTSYKQQRKFNYDQWFSVLVEKEKPFILLSPNCVYMLLSHRVDLSYAFWIARVDGRTPHGYELEFQSVDGKSLTLKGSTQNPWGLFEDVSPERCICVPPKLLTSTRHLNVKIKMSFS